MHSEVPIPLALLNESFPRWEVPYTRIVAVSEYICIVEPFLPALVSSQRSYEAPHAVASWWYVPILARAKLVKLRSTETGRDRSASSHRTPGDDGSDDDVRGGNWRIDLDPWV